MCYDTMSYGIYVIVGIKVYHVSRGLYLGDTYYSIYSAVAELRLHRYKLERQQYTFSCLDVSEQSICTDTGQQKCDRGSEQLIVQIHKPDIALAIHTHVIYLLGVRVEVVCYKKRLCR